ncbi:MAG: 50S ribosomal protein L9 [Pseudomonadota bacterium]
MSAEIILIEDVYKLGRVGDVVNVKPGYARNFLIPQKKALRATKANIEAFESQKKELQKRADDNRNKAIEISDKLAGKMFVIIEQASEKGMLYGAVTSVSASKVLNENGYNVAKDAVQIIKPIKSVGIYNVDVLLHADVTCNIALNVAVSNEAADEQYQESLKVPDSSNSDESNNAEATQESNG